MEKKRARISLKEQLRLMISYYPEGNVELVKKNGFVWTGTLKSSPLGDLYTVKVVFELNKKPRVYVIAPETLNLAKGKKTLPHVYDTKQQNLCLFYPNGKEWNSSKMLASTILPWTIEWLYHYELWLITGNWSGGGTKH